MATVEMVSYRVMHQILDRNIESRREDNSFRLREFGSCCTCTQSFLDGGWSQSIRNSHPCHMCTSTRNSPHRLPAHTISKSRLHCFCDTVRCSSTNGRRHGQKFISQDEFEQFLNKESFVHWFREAWPYIQGHRSSVFVIVVPGDVIADSKKIDGILQDILLLDGLGVKLVVIPGTQPQIDQLLIERGLEPEYEGAYRITGKEALYASMEAAGRIKVTIEAKLSRGTSFPNLQRSGDSDRWNEVIVASGNYVAAKRRGIVSGVDFGATGEVKRIDVRRIKQDLDRHSIVLLSNLGYSSTGEVLNCNTYEVATACAIALQADKLLCFLDGPPLDDNGRPFRFMTLREADKLIRESASQSSAAADYVKAVAGPAYVKSLGLPVGHDDGCIPDGNGNGDRNRPNGRNNHTTSRNGYASNGNTRHSSTSAASAQEEKHGKGFAIGGLERFSRTYGYLSELTAAVFACRHGVGRVHMLDSNVNGALLLELYSRDGVGNMVSSDSYEGTRGATSADLPSVQDLLEPVIEEGILVRRRLKELKHEIKNYVVVERDGSIIACCALFPYENEKCGELASFAVSPECRTSGIGTSLLEYVEKLAEELEMEKLFLLTTRTADWFIQRGFTECTVDILPESCRHKIDFARKSKYYEKYIKQGASNVVYSFS